LWTPDGKGLLYRENDPSRASNSIVWLQPVAGGEPRQFLNVKPEQIFNISPSADGKQFLLVRGKLLTDAVMLTQVKW
jgi:dipeptidyl aminopeptidase/acylaminoacyl peptidase